MPEPKLRAAIIMGGAAALFGMNAVTIAALSDRGATAVSIHLWRYFGSLAILVLSRGTAIRRLAGTGVLLSAIPAGLLGFLGVPLLLTIALSRAPVGIVLLLEFLAPVYVVLWLTLVGGLEWSARVLTSVVLVFVGLAMLLRPGQTNDPVDAIGIAAAVAAGVLLAAYYVTNARVSTNKVDALGWLTSCIVVALPPAIALALLYPIGTLLEPTSVSWPLALCTLVAGTILPYYFLIRASKSLDSHRISLIATLEPVVAITAAAALLSQDVSPVQAVGASIVISAILLSIRALEGHTGPPRQQASPS